MMAIVIHETQKVKLSYKLKKQHRLLNLNNLITDSGATCKSELRINRHTFHISCEMFRDIGGLSDTRFMSLENIVTMIFFIH